MSATIERAMLLAAGYGRRMRPLTDHAPKPLLKVGGLPLIAYALRQLERAGVRQVVVNAAYKSEMIEAYINSYDTKMECILSREAIPLETGGGIAHALEYFKGEPFYSLNSDTICLDGYVPSLERLRRRWDAARMDALLLVQRAATAFGYSGRGDFIVDEVGRLRRRHSWEVSPFVFTGVQILHPDLFAEHPDGPFSMNVLYDQRAGEEGWLDRIEALPHDGLWLHVGDPKALEEANQYLQQAY